MENSSTATRIGKRLTVGIDVGDRYSRICVLDAEGEVMEAGFLMTEEAAFRRRFTGMEPCLTAMEASTHSPWLSRLIEDLGHECLVANPATLKGKNRKKSDKIDAEKLARWARSDPKLLEPIRHAGAEVQADMALIHSRRSLIEARTKLINRARRLVKSFGSDCDLRRWGLKKAAGGKNAKKRAVVAVARKLAVLLHYLWLTGEKYEPLRRPEAAGEPSSPPSPQPSAAVKVRPSDASSRFQTLTAALKDK